MCGVEQKSNRDNCHLCLSKGQDLPEGKKEAQGQYWDSSPYPSSRLSPGTQESPLQVHPGYGKNHMSFAVGIYAPLRVLGASDEAYVLFHTLSTCVSCAKMS